MHLEVFSEGDSFLHQLDARARFVSVIPFVTVTAVAGGLRGPLAALLVALVLSGSARLDLGALLGRLLVVNFFILFLWLFLPFGSPGEVLFSLGPLTATREGIFLALAITLKCNAIVLATIAILGTSPVFTLAHALIHLKAPVKLVYVFFFFYRYLSVLHAEYSRLRRAMTLRCFKPRSSMHTYRSYAWLLGMLFVRSFERSERVYKAMVLRGFKGGFPLLHHFTLKRSDIVFSLMLVLTSAVVASL